MRIGVVADTHLQKGDHLPPQLLAGLRGCEMILHAGDLVTLEVVFQLERVAPVRAVCGNMDGPDVRGRCPTSLVVEAAGRKIGLTHGSGAPDSIAQRVRREFDEVDAIVFGHSHFAMTDTLDGVLMVNPGSPTDDELAPARTFGIIEIDEESDTLDARIVELPTEP